MDAMVTGRMDIGKKEAGNAVLARAGLNASQAINLMYSRLLEEQNADFLLKESPLVQEAEWAAAAAFVDSLVEERKSAFDNMSKAEIKMSRLASKGLVQ